MAKSYTFYNMTSFPSLEEGEILSTKFQRSLIQGVEEPRTTLRFERNMHNPPLEVLRIKYESIEHRLGRAKGVEFEEFVATTNFPAFYHRNMGVLMLRAKKDIARGAMHMFDRDRSLGISGSSKTFDLQSVQELVQNLKGAWFHVQNSADVFSQAFFGPRVDQDERFMRALDEGTIINVRISYTYGNQPFNIGIGEDYSLVIFDNNLDEQFELGLVLDLKANIFDKAKLK